MVGHCGYRIRQLSDIKSLGKSLSILLLYNSLPSLTVLAQTKALQEAPVCMACHPSETTSYLTSAMGIR